MNPLFDLFIAAGAAFNVFILAVMARRLLNANVSLLRALIAGGLAYLLATPLVKAMVGPNPQHLSASTLVWFAILAVACAPPWTTAA